MAKTRVGQTGLQVRAATPPRDGRMENRSAPRASLNHSLPECREDKRSCGRCATPAARTMFVSHKAPCRPFVNTQILNAVLRVVFKKLGLRPPRTQAYMFPVSNSDFAALWSWEEWKW